MSLNTKTTVRSTSSSKKTSSEPKGFPYMKMGLSLGLLLVAIGVFANSVRSAMPSADDPVAKANPQVASAVAATPTQDRPSGPPSPEEREKRRNEMIAKLNLTPEQKKQAEEIRAKAEANPEGNRMAGFQALYEILTPEQKKIAEAERANRETQMQQRAAQRREEASKILSPEDMAVYDKKAAERRERMQQMRSQRGGEDAQQRGQRRAQ